MKKQLDLHFGDVSGWGCEIASKNLKANSLNQVHIVFGVTGEYSERDEWPVAAYLDEEIAKEHVRLATQGANEYLVQYNNMLTRADQDAWKFEHKNPYDPDMQLDYLTGTSYYIISVTVHPDLEPPC